MDLRSQGQNKNVNFWIDYSRRQCMHAVSGVSVYALVGTIQIVKIKIDGVSIASFITAK